MIVLFSEVVMIVWLMGISCTSDFFISYFLGDAPLMDMFFQKNVIFDNLKLHFLLRKTFYLCYSFKQIFLAFLIAIYFSNKSIISSNSYNELQ